MKRKTLNLIVGILLVVVFALWLFVFKVRQNEIALVTTFGKPTGAPIDQPGAYFKWPWPIQKVHTFDKRVQNLDDKLDESLTADGKILSCMVYVGWQISDPAAFYPKFASASLTDPEGDSIAQAESRLRDIARSYKKVRLGKHNFSDLISTDAAQFKFEAIEGEMLADMQAAVRSNNYGIELKYLGIKKLAIPESSTPGVFDSMKAERNVQVKTITAEGDIQVAAIRQAARSESQRLIADAEARANVIRGEGELQAAEYLKVFQQNTNLANLLLELGALPAVVNSNAVLILDQKTMPLELLNIK